MKHIVQATRIAYQEKSTLVVTALAFVAVLDLNYYSLIATVSGSSLVIFFETSAWWQILLPIVVSAFIALLIGMQVYMLRQRRAHAAIKASTGVFSSFTGIIGSVFGSAGCFSCLTALLGFLGTGTLLILLKYRYAIIGVSLALLLVSLHLTAKSIACGVCTDRGGNKHG